jgi:hypothetical protein
VRLPPGNADHRDAAERSHPSGTEWRHEAPAAEGDRQAQCLACKGRGGAATWQAEALERRMEGCRRLPPLRPSAAEKGWCGGLPTVPPLAAAARQCQQVGEAALCLPQLVQA